MCPGNLDTPYFPVKGIYFGGFPLKNFRFELRKYVFSDPEDRVSQKGVSRMYHLTSSITVAVLSQSSWNLTWI